MMYFPSTYLYYSYQFVKFQTRDCPEATILTVPPESLFDYNRHKCSGSEFQRTIPRSKNLPRLLTDVPRSLI